MGLFAMDWAAQSLVNAIFTFLLILFVAYAKFLEFVLTLLVIFRQAKT
jgi:membrane-anchored protein YejM (alkaline phosphatase superfamily)